MRTIKTFISVICVIALLLCGTVNSAAVPLKECSYTGYCDNRTYAPKPEKATIKNGCLYYAILSTAGSYAKKYFNASDSDADFIEENLQKSVDNPDVHNFGDMLYKSIGCNIGNGYSITSVEFLSGKGDRYLKEKIKENGAIVAAFALPDDSEVVDSENYNKETHSFAYTKPDLKNDKFHAVSIVGWDDSYHRANFNKDKNGSSIAKSNGAWICKNTASEDSDGYFYMSYTTPLIYSAALEVSKVSGVNLVLTSNQLLKYVGFIYGVNVRAYSAGEESIVVKIGDKIAFDGNVELKNGCNLILFDRPVLSDKVSITGENISTSPDTVYCYFSLLPQKKMTVRHADKDKNWVEDVEIMRISVSGYNESCKSKDSNGEYTIHHKMIKDSADNTYNIIPKDGFRFTEDTIIRDIYGFDDDIPGYDFFKHDSTIKEAIEAKYERLTDDDGNWIKMIDFDQEQNDGRGLLKIVSQNIGSAYVNNINILTNENGEIKNALMTFDYGAVISYDADVKMYRDAEHTEEITDTANLEKYFAEIKIDGYYADDLTVSINGTPINADVDENGDEITINAEISIPDITIAVEKIFPTISSFFAQIFSTIIRNVGRR